MLEHLITGNSWAQYVPFASMILGTSVEENRPAMTKILEQSFVGIVAAMIGSYVTINVHQSEIDNLKQQRIESDARTSQAISEMSRQVSELRQVLLHSNR